MRPVGRAAAWLFSSSPATRGGGGSCSQIRRRPGQIWWLRGGGAPWCVGGRRPKQGGGGGGRCGMVQGERLRPWLRPEAAGSAYSGHGGLEMVGLGAFCARATGAATSWLLLPFSFSTATLVRRHHGGGAGAGRCLLVVPRWYFGRGRASFSRGVADAAGSGLLAWPRACGRHGVEPGESLHWHFVGGDGGGAVGASLFLLGASL